MFQYVLGNIAADIAYAHLAIHATSINMPLKRILEEEKLTSPVGLSMLQSLSDRSTMWNSHRVEKIDNKSYLCKFVCFE